MSPLDMLFSCKRLALSELCTVIEFQDEHAVTSCCPGLDQCVDLCRFLRFPGGCYVEGVNMRNAFFWKPSVGPLEERPGHWNGPWEYWSTDGERAL